MQRPISLVVLAFERISGRRRRRAASALQDLDDSSLIALARFRAMDDTDDRARLAQPTRRWVWPAAEDLPLLTNGQ